MLVQIRTKNYSAKPLQHSINMPVRSIVRLGSLTSTKKAFPNSYDKKKIVEINTVEGIQTSRDKKLMKNAFLSFPFPIYQAKWYVPLEENKYKEIDYKGEEHELSIKNIFKGTSSVVVKRRWGFKGRGMKLIKNADEFQEFITNHDLTNYIIEKFYDYGKEYRIHVALLDEKEDDKNVIMVWRKVRRHEAEEKWFFNSTNCNWVSPDNELFDIPPDKVWREMISHSIKAMKAVNLDLGTVDVRVKSKITMNNKSKNPDFIICEVNSAPALGEQGVEVYREVIQKLIVKHLKK